MHATGSGPGDHAARVAAHGEASNALAALGDEELRTLVEAAPVLGHGIGGQVRALEAAGVPVFVKRVPLTARELLPEHRGSTANLSGLPAFCHYGAGGPGFGGWRELAAHELATGWVLDGVYQGFPMLYHHRVLPGEPTPLPEELADIERVVAYWDGSPAVRERLGELAASPASLLLLMERLPGDLHGWLHDRAEEGGPAFEDACAMVERELGAAVEFLAGHGLLHFDTHFENFLTDGRRLYLGDFGLAVADGFALDADEVAFAREYRSFDAAYTSNHLCQWLTTELTGLTGAERAAFLAAWAAGDRRAELPPAASAILDRHAPVAVRFGEFLRAMLRESRHTPYPAAEIESELARLAAATVSA